ncbi:hypothetical protein D3C72_1572210 [compost metagenome]
MPVLVPVELKIFELAASVWPDTSRLAVSAAATGASQLFRPTVNCFWLAGIGVNTPVNCFGEKLPRSRLLVDSEMSQVAATTLAVTVNWALVAA